MEKGDVAKLEKAARAGDLKLLEPLLKQLHPQKDKSLLDRALWPAIFGRQPEAVGKLLEAGANPEQTSLVGTFLMCAAKNGDLAIVKRLVEAGADVNREAKRETALSAALSENQVPVIEYLEKLGAKSPPTTTLLYASTHGDLKRAEGALAEGAEIEKTGGTFRETPLMAASRKGHVAIVKLLLKHGANPNKKIHARTALFEAVEHGKNLDMVEDLIMAGADLEAKYYDETILMAAAKGGSLLVVKELVERGAKVHARDKTYGKTALDYAKDGKHKDVIAFLSELGLVAERDAGHNLIRALAKEFGGKFSEHSQGFTLDSKLAEYKCQFQVYPDHFSVAVFGLKYLDVELRRSETVGIILGKAESWDGEVQEVKQGTKILEVRVFRSSGEEAVSEKFVLAFCARYQDKLKQLGLQDKERFQIHGSGMRFSMIGTEMNSLHPRLQLFASLIQEISREPQPDRQLFSKEWLLKPAPKSRGKAGVSPHSFGGNLDEPVGCPLCGSATNLMAQLDLSDRVLPKTGLGSVRLPVFWCLTCLEWDPAFFDISGPFPKILGTNGEDANVKAIEPGEENLSRGEMMLVPIEHGKKAGRKSKLGGFPTWIQSEEIPDCPKCEKAMAFVLQLASHGNFSYADMGMLYAFACPECCVTASLVQSH